MWPELKILTKRFSYSRRYIWRASKTSPIAADVLVTERGEMIIFNCQLYRHILKIKSQYIVYMCICLSINICTYISI